MHQHGFVETVAPLGTSFTEPQAKLLRRFAEPVVLVFDGDEAGRKAARAAHAVCSKAGLIARVGVLPPKMDPDSYLRSITPDHGRDGMTNIVTTGPSIVEWLIQDAGANCGDNVPERVAAVRALAPVIADVRDALERDVYVRLAAKKLYLEEQQVRTAIREFQAGAAKAARESPFNDPRRRPGLTNPQETPTDPNSMARLRSRATANALEAVLLRPELLETDDAAVLPEYLDEAMANFVRLARAQWLGERRLDWVTLLDACPNDRVRAWVGERLMPPAEDDDAAAGERFRAMLADATAELRRLDGLNRARAMKHVSAKAGTQGDPSSELGTLNEQLRLKRELAASRAANRQAGGNGGKQGPG